MQENRNSSCGLSFDGRGSVCIDTKRVLDCCRDRDCFEDTRVYLSEEGEAIINNATGVRLKCAKLVWAYVGVDPIVFNRGFYRVTVRYYVKVEGEGCVCIGRSQCFEGIAVLEKEVVLYGGEGSLVSFSSTAEDNFCNVCNQDNMTVDAPTAVVETVEPIILGHKISDCSCPCSCNECGCEIPEVVCGCLNGELVTSSEGARLYVSFGIFSVIRIIRPAQLLVQATDYSVPDKECTPATSDENPCALFRTMAFPVNQFRTPGAPIRENGGGKGGGCGCGK
ncbi:MAG: hypothetical protein IJD51_05090 [Clostridia bacterium]|nr:hypothetical protein [Clostridia bacterium]